MFEKVFDTVKTPATGIGVLAGATYLIKEASWITSVHAFERWCYTVDELLEALAVAESVMAFGLADEIRWAISEHVIAEE